MTNMQQTFNDALTSKDDGQLAAWLFDRPVSQIKTAIFQLCAQAEKHGYDAAIRANRERTLDIATRLSAAYIQSGATLDNEAIRNAIQAAEMLQSESAGEAQ